MKENVFSKATRNTALNKNINDEIELRHQAEQISRELEVRLEERQAQNQKAFAQLEENKDILKQEFKHLAHDILKPVVEYSLNSTNSSSTQY